MTWHFFLITKMNLQVKKKKKICNHGKCDWVKEAMEGEKPTTLVCTVLPINHTNLCYKPTRYVLSVVKGSI